MIAEYHAVDATAAGSLDRDAVTGFHGLCFIQMLLLKSEDGVGSGRAVGEFDIDGGVRCFHGRNTTGDRYDLVGIFFIGRGIIRIEFIDEIGSLYGKSGLPVAGIGECIGRDIPVNPATGCEQQQDADKEAPADGKS